VTKKLIVVSFCVGPVALLSLLHEQLAAVTSANAVTRKAAIMAR
jgi:hypothetical protein